MYLCCDWSKTINRCNVVKKLEEHGALEHTIVVSAPAADPAPMQFLSAYAGCTMGDILEIGGRCANCL